MKQNINEVKRMQQLAGVIKENEYYGDSSSEVKKFIVNELNNLLNKLNSKFDFENNFNDKEAEPYNLVADLIKKIQGLNESQLNENSFGPDDNFQWKISPTNPKDMVRDEEEGDTMTKAEFWRDNITGRSPEDANPSYGLLQPNGTWSFSWDTGEFSGFIEGDDFIL
jgi:hypothetical protein